MLLNFFHLRAQTGNYFLSHYSPGEDRIDNVCFDIIQNDQGLFFYATRNGLLQFDGKNWDLIQGGGAIYSLRLSSQGEVYWAGATGYGKVETEVNGNKRLKVLSAEDVRDVFQCVAVQNKLYFLSDRILFIEQDQSHVQKVDASDATGMFISMFELFGTVYLSTEKDGIYKVDEKGALIKNSFTVPASEEIIFSTGLKNQYLIALTNNKVLLCGEDLRPRELTLQDQAYLDASVVVSGAWVNQDLFVLGTLRGGLVFIQVATGKTQEIINYSTGLPDNEVYALTSDHNQSIWAAHEYGFTRVSPYLPFRSFNHYPGIEGNLLCAHSFGNEVYVGTSLGLFKLQKEEFYEELTYYVDVEIKEARPAKSKARETVTEKRPTEEASQPEPESKRRGFLRFLKKNRGEKEAEPPIITPEKNEAKPGDNVAQESSTKPRYQRVKKTEKILRASQYVYKRVEGVEAKVTSLLEFNGHLLAAGLGGLFEIKGLQSTPISEEPVRIAYASKILNGMVIGSYADKVHAFRNESDKKWAEITFLSNLDDQIISIVDGPGQELWLCALDKAYKVSFDDARTVKHVESVDIPNQAFDEVACVNWKDQLVLVNSAGFFRYNQANKNFVKIDSTSAPTQYFLGESSILYNDSHRWSLLGQKDNQGNLQLLNLLHNLRFVSGNYSGDNLWVITGGNELYRFFGEMFTPYEAGYSLMIKSIRKGDKEIQLNKLEFEQDKSPVTLRVAQPDYLAPQAIEYRYQLKGLDNAWSEWSSHYNNIDFPYLPSGDYSLVIQSRDILGVVRELQAISFEVLPPYWKRPWFYALEFFVFAGFVLLSFRLSTRYRIISRILSLLTIIMLIQFIQTVVSETFETRASPVMDFFMQVMVAFLILPVEGYLRGLMLQSLDAKGKLYQFLTPRRNQAPEENDS